MTRALLLLLLLAAPAAAQAPRCGFGLGLEALRGAERSLAAGSAAEGLLAGREAAEAGRRVFGALLGEDDRAGHGR